MAIVVNTKCPINLKIRCLVHLTQPDLKPMDKRRRKGSAIPAILELFVIYSKKRIHSRLNQLNALINGQATRNNAQERPVTQSDVTTVCEWVIGFCLALRRTNRLGSSAIPRSSPVEIAGPSELDLLSRYRAGPSSRLT